MDKTNIDIDKHFTKPYIFALFIFTVLHSVLFLSHIGNTIQINFLIKLFSALCHGFTFLLLASRLSSKRIRLPKVFIMALFLYAVLQPISFLSDMKEICLKTNYPIDNAFIEKIVCFRYSLLLAGKAIIYLSVVWIFKNEMLFNYFKKIPETEEETDKTIKIKTDSREEIVKLITSCKFKNALEKLNEYVKHDKDARDRVVLLQSRLNRLEISKPTIALDAYNQEHNSIVASILAELSLINEE